MMRWLLLGLCFVASASAGAPKIEDFLRRATIDGVSLSPDGQLLAVTMPRDDGTTVAFLKTADLSPVAHWNLGEGKETAALKWVTNDRVVFDLATRYGKLDLPYREFGLYTLSLGQKDMGVYLGYSSGQVLGPVPGQAGWVFMYMPGTSIGTHPQLLKFNLRSGKSTRVVMAPADFGNFLLDPQGKVRWFVGSNRDLTQIVLRRDGDEWTEVFRGKEEDHEESPLLIAPDGKGVYVSRVTQTGTLGVQLRDFETGEYRAVSSDPRYDAEGTVVSSDGKELLAVAYDGLRPRLEVVAGDHPEAKLLRQLVKSFGDSALTVLDVSDDGRHWLVGVQSERDPGQFYLYDRDTRQARFLFADMEWLDPADLAEVRAETFEARDGTRIDAYLWLPPGKPASGLPLIVRPHGGPFGVRDTLAFDNEAQLLASQGYAVLSMNFRGSGGYGPAFRRAGHGQWGRLMVDDVTDAARWAIASGVADARRVCIYGASYGAYSALMGAIREPELYRCAIGYAGVYDIPTMESYDDYRVHLANFFDKVYPKSDAEREWQSPARRAGELTVPVMLAHGTKDVVTPLAQYDRMARALKKAGRPAKVTLVKSGEGRGFDNPDNEREFYATMLAFLDKHIGAKAAAGSN